MVTRFGAYRCSSPEVSRRPTRPVALAHPTVVPQQPANALRYTLRVLAATVVLAATGIGCASRTMQGTAVLPADNRAVLAVVREALERDAMAQTAMHLYEPFVTIIANGVERRDPPRFAGMGQGGRVTVAELRGEVLGEIAWAIASYHWTSADGRMVESARVTFVLAPEGNSWRIRHAHSSIVPPWAGD